MADTYAARRPRTPAIRVGNRRAGQSPGVRGAFLARPQRGRHQGQNQDRSEGLLHGGAPMATAFPAPREAGETVIAGRTLLKSGGAGGSTPRASPPRTPGSRHWYSRPNHPNLDGCSPALAARPGPRPEFRISEVRGRRFYPAGGNDFRRQPDWRGVQGSGRERLAIL